MTGLEKQAWETARSAIGTAIEAIVDSRDREAARRRTEACTEELVAEEMLRRLKKWRFLARFHWRRRLNKAAAYCKAQCGNDARLAMVCARARSICREGAALV